jgi:hypothetical protein
MASTTGLSIYVGDAWPAFATELAETIAKYGSKAEQKAWLSHFSKEYGSLYINDGAAKVGINPVGDPISRFPKSPVWCHAHSEAMPAFNASQEVGFTVEVEITRPDRLMDAVDVSGVFSPLLNVRLPESIEFETGKDSQLLCAKFASESWAVDLLHTALTIINYELVNREGLEARVCDFYRTADSIVIGIIGDEKDADQLRAIADTANELCHDLINETATEYEAAF